MNKTDLIRAIGKVTKFKQDDVSIFLDGFIEVIQDEVAKGTKIQITGFGTFERKEQGERTIKNPRTGEPIHVGPSKRASFSAGSVFKEKVNPKEEKKEPVKEEPKKKETKKKK